MGYAVRFGVEPIRGLANLPLFLMSVKDLLQIGAVDQLLGPIQWQRDMAGDRGFRPKMQVAKNRLPSRESARSALEAVGNCDSDSVKVTGLATGVHLIAASIVISLT